MLCVLLIGGGVGLDTSMRLPASLRQGNIPALSLLYRRGDVCRHFAEFLNIEFTEERRE